MSEKKNALVLSGGGSRGSYEAGVWQALLELEIPLHIVTGTSVGAINGAMVVCGKLEKALSLWKEIKTEMIFDIDPHSDQSKNSFEIMGMPSDEAFAYLKKIVTEGGAESSGVMSLLKELLDEDAFRSSPVDYGLVATEFPSLKPHYIYKDEIPQGLLCEYIVASASCFPAAQYMQINNVKYIDGGYADNLPVEMAMKKGATTIIAVDLQAIGTVHKNAIEQARETCEKYISITCPWDLGNFLSFEPKTAERNMRLGYLDTMRAFDRYCGIHYAFEKDIFSDKELQRADAAAKTFDLDPTVIYNKKSLNSILRDKLLDSQVALKKQTIQFGKLIDPVKTVQNIPALRDELSEETLVTLIAESIRRKHTDSLFFKKYVLSILRHEVIAASYIVSERLLHE